MSEEHEKAKRTARAIASDICLYNQEKVEEGILNDNFFDVLKDEIEEGRAYYKGKVSTEIYDSTNYFDRALIDVILKAKAGIKSNIW